jgi:hypothetical protein
MRYDGLRASPSSVRAYDVLSVGVHVQAGRQVVATETKATLGPWHVERENNSHGFAYRPNTLAPSFKVFAGAALVAYVGTDESDAHIIAAAPDLLAACRKALASLHGDDDRPSLLDVEHAVVTAIAKAEGK